jgi:putative ABC transport system permease protein
LAIPISYNVLSVRARWTSSMVAILGIAGTVSVFVAMLALANGFRATLISSGSPQNAKVRRAGSSGEMESIILIEQLRAIEDTAGIEVGPDGPLVSPEVVVMAALPLRETGTDANVLVRGLSPRVLQVRQGLVRVAEGRFFTPGLAEAVVGRNAATAYAGLDLGSSLQFGGGTWKIVGVLDAGGSAFDSEIWCDSAVLNGFYQRPPAVYQSVTARLRTEEAFAGFKAALEADKRVTVQVEREAEYYAKQSRAVSTMIYVLGSLVAAIMGLGAIFGALNTMYAAVSERTREIATLRAIGYGRASIVLSFLLEALFIALLGGTLGCLIVIPVNGLTTGTMNWQTFSHLAFAFQVTPGLLALGLVFALVMGAAGGLPPAIRAARAPVAAALRGL